MSIYVFQIVGLLGSLSSVVIVKGCGIVSREVTLDTTIFVESSKVLHLVWGMSTRYHLIVGP